MSSLRLAAAARRVYLWTPRKLKKRGDVEEFWGRQWAASAHDFVKRRVAANRPGIGHRSAGRQAGAASLGTLRDPQIETLGRGEKEELTRG